MAQPKLRASSVYTKIKCCRMCGVNSLELVLSLGTQFIIGFVKERNDDLPKAPLDLVRCQACGLLQLLHSVEPDLLWGETYGYKSSINESMRAALLDVVNDALATQKDGTWLDIGANDGYLVSQIPQGFRKLACEPVKMFHPVLEEHADKVIPTFFSAEAVDEKCDVITTAAMYYDLDDPNAFTADIAKMLSKDGVWINQLTSTKSMLEKNDFPNIVHEHRLYLSERDIQKLYAKHGLSIVKISNNDVNGGSMRITAKHQDSNRAEIPPIPPISNQEISDFANRVVRWQQLMRWVFDMFKLSGRTVWGAAASTKGSVLLQFLDRSDQIIGIADRNPQKEGLQVPGVWVPITNEAALRQARPDVVLGLAWPFKDSINQREAEMRRLGTAMLWPLPEISFTT